ncbi:MAG TPA: hypothetical protein VM101_12265 [Flavitalea sp.]|nr:hypothetical protein [Flavitalea sp.]
MNVSLFENVKELNADYLEAAYSDDAETAVMVFEQYLQDLPSNLLMLQESYGNKDLERFLHYVHKQKPGFSYVGLTDVTEKFHELQVKCHMKEDLDTYKMEIEEVLKRIKSSEELVRRTMKMLKGQ